MHRSTSSLLTALAFLAVQAPADAALILTDCGFGPGSCVRDTATNLEWVQPSATLINPPGTHYKSFNTVSFEIASVYAGFNTVDSFAILDFFNAHGTALNGLLEPTIGPQIWWMSSSISGAGGLQGIRVLNLTTGVQGQSADFPTSSTTFIATALNRTAPVPEPQTLATLFCGLAALLVRLSRCRG